MTSQGVLDQGATVQTPVHRSQFSQACNELALGAGFARRGKGSRWQLILISVCIGLGVALLLIAASLPRVDAARENRTVARTPITFNGAVNYDGPVYIRSMTTTFHGSKIFGQAITVVPGVTNPPVPPGVPALPQPGQFFVSPDLKAMLADPTNAELRQRLPYPITGEIDSSGLVGPRDLFYYLGVEDGAGYTKDPPNPGWGMNQEPDQQPVSEDRLTPVLWLVLSVGMVVLVVPILVFLGMLTRVGSASRDLRLAQLRLLGASKPQCRRVAAGEALIPAVVGTAIGVGLFHGIGWIAERSSIFGPPIFAGDLLPIWWLYCLIVVATPSAAVALSWLALRRVFRSHRRPQKTGPRLWWRLLVLVIGFVLLGSQDASFAGGANGDLVILIGGAALVLVSVPLLVTALMHKIALMLPTAGPSWTLAVRSLKSGSGLTSRIVGGIGLVLAGTIALQSLFASGLDRYVPDSPNQIQFLDDGRYEIYAGSITPADSERLWAVGSIPGVISADMLASSQMTIDGAESTANLLVASCATVAGRQDLGTELECSDGDILAFGPANSGLAPGAQISAVQLWDVPIGTEFSFALPAQTTVIPSQNAFVLVTPGALASMLDPQDLAFIFPDQAWSVQVDQTDAGVLDRIQTALAPNQWRTSINDGTRFEGAAVPEIAETIKSGLTAGAGFTLLFALLSLIVMMLEQNRSRRRALAMAVAGGLPPSVLARSQLIGIAIPLVLGVVIADLLGIALSVALLSQAEELVQLSYAAIAGLSGLAIVLSLLIGALALPAIRRATRPEALRSE